MMQEKAFSFLTWGQNFYKCTVLITLSLKENRIECKFNYIKHIKTKLNNSNKKTELQCITASSTRLSLSILY